MVDKIVPHFHNEPGKRVIEIGAREFQCVGALPPNDHPHVYLDMGDSDEIVCPYCSTLTGTILALRRTPRAPPNVPLSINSPDRLMP
jgi:uncharacterized Zn-finger protein